MELYIETLTNYSISITETAHMDPKHQPHLPLTSHGTRESIK